MRSVSIDNSFFCIEKVDAKTNPKAFVTCLIIGKRIGNGYGQKLSARDVDSVERFDDFRRRKSPKIAQNRGRKSPN